MSQKRHQDDANPAGPPRSEVSGSSSDDKRRKVPSLKNKVLEVMKLRRLQHYMEPVLEPLIRRVVKEEIELALGKYVNSMKQNTGKETPLSETQSLRLQFLNSISLPVFTGTRIEGEDSASLKVALIDDFTGKVVSNGPESSAKVEIVVLEGVFYGDDGDNWTNEEFKSNIVRERAWKKPLLTGDSFLSLKEGIGLVGEISFTDNSSWTRSRKFRLGARFADNCDFIGVRGAKTKSFVVRDHRGELYKKHHPPSLLDEVWRLEKVGKDGAFHKRLTKEKVNTVKDFLTLLNMDPTRLRNILGTGMSTKMWEATAEHARTCLLDKKLYLYYPPDSQHKTGVVFNIVGQVTALISDGQYIQEDKLSDSEKNDAQNMVISAFGNFEGVLSFDDMASLINTVSNMSHFYPINSPTMQSIDDFGLNCVDNSMDDVRLGQALNSYDRVSYDDEHLKYFDSLDFTFENSSMVVGPLQADLQSVVSGFLSPPSATAVVAIDKKAQRRWTILFSILKWFSIRRIVARKSSEI